MKRSHPVHDFNSIDMLKMLAVVCYHYEVFDLCRAADEQVEIVNLLPSLPERRPLLCKGMNGLVEWYNLHFTHEILYLPEIVLNPVAIVSPKQKLGNHGVGDIAIVFVNLVESFFNTVVSSEQEHTDTGIEQISFHSSTSNELVVRAERISRTISSAERESFQVPAKRLAQPFLCESVCSWATVIELLSRAISSIFSVLLRSFNSDQIRALVGDVTFKPFMLIDIFVIIVAAKIRIISEKANKNNIF